jgi:hypothetical protein
MDGPRPVLFGQPKVGQLVVAISRYLYSHMHPIGERQVLYSPVHMSLVDGFQVIRKVLIANRGEIACRIIASCKRLDLTIVAIYSKADRSSLHVRLADEACLLPGSDQSAYIDEDAILEIARRTGAEAVIPGYGASGAST